MALFPISTFMYLAAIYIFPPLVIFGIYIFLHCLRERCRSKKKGRELPPSRGWRQFPALPSAPAVEPRVHIND
jgi:hypothetical protein